MISAPDPVPLFPAPALPAPAAKAKGAPQAQDDADDGDDSDDSDDNDDDDDDDDDDTVPGFIAPGSDTCVAISGTFSFGVQRDWFKANAAATATGLIPPNATSTQRSLSFRLESAQTLANGLYLATAFEFSLDQSADDAGKDEATLSEASLTVGPWVFGVTDSRFDFWSGDDFVFSTRVPSRTVALIAYERALFPDLKLSFSLEDTNADAARALPTPSGSHVPDGVVRLLYEGDELTLHGAVALHEVPVAGPAPSRFGRAAILGATWTGDLFGHSSTVTGQIAGAIDAPTYIGSQLDRRVVRPVLFADDATRGWSGVIALGRDWTDEISSNAYVSRYELTLPRLGVREGRIRIDRFTTNLVWKPIEGFKTGIEASVAWQRLDLGGRIVPAFSGRQTSVQLFLERTF